MSTPPSFAYVSWFTWSPMIIVLVAAFCTIFLFFCYYIILRRYFSLFQVPHFGVRPETRLLNENNPADDPLLHVQAQGLNVSVVQFLHTVQFRNSEREAADCAVCLGEFEEGERVTLLPNCAHIFHASCTDAWFRTHSTCPICRSDVVQDSSTQQQQGFSVSTLALETLRREDAYREGSHGYNVLESEITQQSSMVWHVPTR